jgi:hypothetical protein
LCGVDSLDIWPDVDRRAKADEHLRGDAIAFIVAAGQSAGQNAMDGFQFVTEDACFVDNLVYLNGRPVVVAGGLDAYIGGPAKYQSYGDCFVNYRTLSIFLVEGASIALYHTRFFGEGGFFPDGHHCATPAIEAAYVRLDINDG